MLGAYIYRCAVFPEHARVQEPGPVTLRSVETPLMTGPGREGSTQWTQQNV